MDDRRVVAVEVQQAPQDLPQPTLKGLELAVFVLLAVPATHDINHNVCSTQLHGLALHSTQELTAAEFQK